METQDALIDDISLITDTYVHVFVLYTEQEMEEVLMTTRQQLSVENMRDIVLAAYSNLLSRASGGASPAQCAKQLSLAIPVRLRLCFRNHHYENGLVTSVLRMQYGWYGCVTDASVHYGYITDA